MNSHDTPLFASSTNTYYDINYELSEQQVIPKLESLNLPQDVDYQHLDDRESYAFLCDQWKNQISLNSENVLLPIQLGFSYQTPSSPYIPTAEEKKPSSEAQRIAARKFDVKNTPLYPENYLYMLDFIMKEKPFCEDNQNFPKPGPRGQKIPILNHIRPEKPWFAHMISPKPNPNFYKSYESYKRAMLNWYSINQNQLKNELQKEIIKPIQMEKLLKVPIQSSETNSDSRDHLSTQNNISFETAKKIEFMNQKHFSKYQHIKPNDFQNLQKNLQVLYSNFTQVSPKASTGELSPIEIEFPDKFEIERIKFSNQEKIPIYSNNFQKLMTKFDSNGAQYLYQSQNMHPTTQLFLFLSIIRIFNNEKGLGKTDILNDLETFEKCANLANHFCPHKLIIIKNNLNGLQNSLSQKDSIFVIAAYKALLEQHYTHVMLHFFEFFSHNYQTAFAFFQRRFKHLSEHQTNVCLTIGQEQIANWFISSQEGNDSYILVDFLYLISEYASNSKTYFTKIEKQIPTILNNLSPSSFFRLKTFTFLNSSLMTNLFESLITGICFVYGTRLSSFRNNVIEFISVLFIFHLANPALMKPSFDLLTKCLQIITSSEFSDEIKPLYFDLIYSICKFLKRSCDGDSNCQESISQACSFLVSTFSDLPNTDSLALIIDSIKTLTSSRSAAQFINKNIELFRFIFDIIQKNTNEFARTKIKSIAVSASQPSLNSHLVDHHPTFSSDDFSHFMKTNESLLINENTRNHAWNLLTSLLIKSSSFRESVSVNGVFHNEFCQITNSPPILGQLAVIQVAISFILNEIPNNNNLAVDSSFINQFKSLFEINIPELTSRLFETDNENLERMLFNYKYRLNSMMNYIFAHENEFDFPKKFFILSIIQAILDCKDSEKALKRKGSPKPKLPFDFFS